MHELRRIVSHGAVARASFGRHEKGINLALMPLSAGLVAGRSGPFAFS